MVRVSCNVQLVKLGIFKRAMRGSLVPAFVGAAHGRAADLWFDIVGRGMPAANGGMCAP